jgi:hypothetical protein
VIAGLLHGPGVVLARIPAADLVLLVVVIGAALAIARGLATDRHQLARLLPMIAAILVATGAVSVRVHGGLTGFWAQATVIAIVAVLLVLHFFLDRGAGIEERESQGPVNQAYLGARWLVRAPGHTYLIVALLLAGLLLAWHLTTFAGSTLVWESPVTTGFGEAFYAGQSPFKYALDNLAWNEGLVSNGNASLLYGAPTYALLTHVGFSTLSLRLFATIAAFLLVIALWAFASRHHGPAAGAVTAVVASLNTYVIFYGKYGTSLAATMLTCVLAALAVGELTRIETAVWWHGLVAGAALFLATLHYSPGRLVVIVLLASLVPTVVTAWRRRVWRSLAAFAGLAAVIAAVGVGERAVDAQHAFLHARGEQLFTIISEADYVRDYLARDVPAFDAFKHWAAGIGLMRDVPNAVRRNGGQRVPTSQLSSADRFEVVFKVLAETLPQCNRLLSPFELTDASEQSIFDDPPSIKPYFAPLVAFTLLGFASSLRRLWTWRHAVLLAWSGMTVVSVLLTTRLDAHRIFLIAIPLCIWTALGIVEVGRALGRLGVGRRPRSALGWSLAALLLVGTGSVVLRQDTDAGEQQRILAAVHRLPGRVVVGALIDHRQRAVIELGLLERTRHDPSAQGRLLAPDLREAPTEGDGSLSPGFLERFRALCRDASVILAPSDRYRVAAGQLQALGLSVTELHEGNLAMWLIRGRPR